MKPFINFIIKEFYHITRDFRTLLVIFGMPFAQILVFGYVIRMEINDANIAILDKSKDYVTAQITSKLLSSGYFRLNAYLKDERSIEKVFKSGEANVVIIFEQDFSRKLHRENAAGVQLLADASNPNIATLISAYTSSIIRDYQQSLMQSQNAGSLVLPEVKMLYNPELRSVFMFVPGLIAIILMLVSAMITSIALTREKEFGTMEVLLVSPLKPALIIFGKVLPYIAIALINSMSVLVVALTVFGLPFKGSFLLFFLEVLLFVCTALSLGIFISTIAKNMQVAMMMSMGGLLMPTMLLSGFVFPVENMPYILQLLSYIIPATWFLKIEKMIMLKGLGIEYFWKETLVLAGMTVFLLVVSIRKFKIRLE